MIKPNFNDQFEYIGVVGGEHRKELFGLVMIEALASGTFVVTYNISNS